MTDNQDPERLTICPLCGDQITRCEISDAGGVRKFSLCCDAPLEIIDNWEVYEGLPEYLQQVAVNKIKDEYAEMIMKSAENARRFKESREKWLAARPELFHGTAKIIPMHD